MFHGLPNALQLGVSLGPLPEQILPAGLNLRFLGLEVSQVNSVIDIGLLLFLLLPLTLRQAGLDERQFPLHLGPLVIGSVVLALDLLCNEFRLL
jgi:hypothetical protein